MRQGQTLVITAVLILVAVVALAVVVDGARLWQEHSRMSRIAQSAANAGLGYVAERMVTMAVPRQTEAAGLPPCAPDSAFGSEFGSCTATPEPSDVEDWLTDDDRQTLVSGEVEATTIGLAQTYAQLNGISNGNEDHQLLEVRYPFGYGIERDNLQIQISIRKSVSILLAGILDGSWTWVEVEALAQIPQR